MIHCPGDEVQCVISCYSWVIQTKKCGSVQAYPSLKEHLYRNACVKRSKKKIVSSVIPPTEVSEAIDIACSPEAVITAVSEKGSQSSEKGVLTLSLGHRLSDDPF